MLITKLTKRELLKQVNKHNEFFFNVTKPRLKLQKERLDKMIQGIKREHLEGTVKFDLVYIKGKTKT